ncbi:MAG: hypothetical protein GC193_13745 [Cryomorphaceae bacterium]|nr:hypothetical protein [Cryomorphaceae bacterium]
MNFIDLGVANWQSAPFIARGIIGLELFLGLALIFMQGNQKRVLKWIIGVLIFFSMYLVLQIMRDDHGDCGCFGTYLSMTPLESLFKNLVLIFMSVLVLREGKSFHWRFSKLINVSVLVVSFTLPHILNPIDLISARNLNAEETNFALDVDLINKNAMSSTWEGNLSSGKHIVAFLSMTCSHCKTTAFKMHVLKNQNPSFSFLMILNGKIEKLSDFLADTRSDNLPLLRLPADPFSKLTGGNVPLVLFVKDGDVLRILKLPELNNEELTLLLN